MGSTNFLPILSLSCDSPDLHLLRSRITGVNHIPSLQVWFSREEINEGRFIPALNLSSLRGKRECLETK
jgi:hypothetical protein